jgi:alkaline phosphatase
MVEGSQVDWAGHNNDPIWMVTDFIAFDDAVKVACDFADENGRTLVLAYPDHNTGGMKIGHYYSDKRAPYTATTVEALVDPLLGMDMSANGVLAMSDGTDEGLLNSIYDNWGISATYEDLDEIAAWQADYGASQGYAMARILSENYTVFGWTTHGHNGETVPVWVYGGDAPVGTIDNTDLAYMAADAMDLNLDRISNRLYVDLSEITSDYEIVDDGNGNLTVEINGAELPISKDYMIKANGTTAEMPGLTVYAPATDKVYVSKKALRHLGLSNYYSKWEF